MIELNHLSKRFPSVPVLDQLDFRLESGKIAFIQGPSGTGKTTLLRLIAGLEIPDRGEISLHGKPVSTTEIFIPPSQREVGFLFQTNALWPHLTVFQNIAFGLRGKKDPDVDLQVSNILDRMDLASLEDRYPSQLSGGQLRRTALARTLVTKPKVLLLDEPLTNLDQDLQGKLLAYLVQTIQDAGLTTLIVTHNKDLISGLEGAAYTLEDGKLHAS